MSLQEPDSAVTPAVEGLLHQLKPRANSLIVTVFGDAIMPRGASIWLGDLVEMMGLFGLSDRLVRTGVYRLSQEGRLSSLSVGRRAQYSLTETGLREFAAAGKRIYASTATPESDEWTLVQGVPEITQAERQDLRRRLKWHGFGQLSTTLMARPGPLPDALSKDLASDGLEHRVLVFTSKLVNDEARQNMNSAATAAWALDELNAEYGAFLTNFSTFDADTLDALSDSDAFAVRILLIHEYRRILLKDPHLPAALLPASWNGSAALSLSAEIYRKLVTGSDRYIAQQMADGAAPPELSDDYWQRFGGLR